MTSPSGTTDITYASLTDRGQQRPANEDFVYAESFRVGAKKSRREWLLLAVADGVGGHQRGDWASEKAVTVLARRLPALLETLEPAEALRSACEAANQVTWKEASSPGLDGAATTLVVALVNLENFWWANVGDSRAYLVRGEKAVQLTQDHSWVEEKVRSGAMTPEEARDSDMRNVITRCIGLNESVEIDTDGPISLGMGERLVLCSDGLYTQVSDDEIATVVNSMRPYEAATHLVHLANERGGPDNVSVIVCSAAMGAA